MANFWFKVEHATLRKPEVLLAAELLGMSRREALGLFLDYFAWLDEHLQDSRNGFVTHVSRKSLEEALQCVGFAATLERIGWATFDDEACTLYVINYSRHNGTTAKSRVLAKDRQSRFRNGPVTRKPLPDEKRRDDIKTILANMSPSAPDNVVRATQPKATRLSSDWVLPSEWRQWALDAHNVPPKQATEISLVFRDFWIGKPGGGGCKLDWEATWRNWVRKETKEKARV